MAKTPAERQQARRARLKREGQHKRELILEPEEERMLAEICTLRRPGLEPYGESEIIGLLIRQNHKKLMQELKSLNKNKCERCGDELPVNSCPLTGDAGCWRTRGPAKLLVKISK
jgi:hypothetical protein